jgi:hypothetical protein
VSEPQPHDHAATGPAPPPNAHESWLGGMVVDVRRRGRWIAALAVVALAAGLLAGREGEGGGPLLGLGGFDPALADPTPLDGRSPREPAGAHQRVLVALSRPSLGARDGAAQLTPRAQRGYVRSLRDESRSLRSALGARGVRLRDVVTFERVFNGFAATVETRDLPGLSSLGVRREPVRRFYPALSEPLPPGAAAAEGEAPTGPTGPAGAPDARGIVAVLAGGSDSRHPDLRGRLAAGFDVVDGDARPAPGPDPRDPDRSESSGTALAGAVVLAGARARPIRIAALRSGPDGVDEHATTDSLIAGLERAVDPDRDGDTSDHDAAALVAVNAPYAGFSASPEATAVAAATSLGMPVVAPAGGEGSGRAGAGTVGSPAAAPDAVAVAARAAPEAIARLTLTAGDTEIEGAAVLAGTELPDRLPAQIVAIPDPGAFLRDPPALRGKAAVVEAAMLPAAQAEAAATAGASLVILAGHGERTLTAIPAGRVSVPVVGVTGAAAEALLAAGPGEVRLGAPEPGSEEPRTGLAPASSRGPTLDGLGKPTFAAPGAATLPVPGGSATLGGAAVAAARVAANLALGGGAEAAGATALDPPDPGPEPEPVPLGALELTESRGTVTGVRFAVGAFERGDPFGDGSLVRAAARLDLVLLDAAGKPIRRLTPPGGARGLLPGKYAYTLPKATREALGGGRFAFRATARTPRRDDTIRRRSGAFSLR